MVAWDLPGHGVSPKATETFDVAALADSVVDLVDSIAPGEAFHYAGVSLGGATGLQLGIKHGERLKSLSVQCTGAKIGTPEGWLERAEPVRGQGTPVVIQGSAERWFAPGFMDREPERSSRLLHSLRDADRFSYAFCCEALAGYDVRAELGSITRPHAGGGGRGGHCCAAVVRGGNRCGHHRRRRHGERRDPGRRGAPGPRRGTRPTSPNCCGASSPGPNRAGAAK